MENYLRKCFWTKEKETRVKFNPGLSANRPSNNWALGFIHEDGFFSSVNYNNVYGRWITTQYLRQIKENSKLNNGGFNKWLEILAGKDLQTKPRKSEDVDFKFSASNGTAKANTVNQRQRLYSDHEYVKRQQQNTTVTLQMKPTKGGNTDCRRFSKIRSIVFAAKPKRGKFTVKIICFETHHL